MAALSAGVVFLTGMAVFLGWMFHLEAFQSVGPGWPKMAPLTAVCFIMAGVALWSAAMALTAQEDNTSWRWLCRIDAAAVAGIGSFKLASVLATAAMAQGVARAQTHPALPQMSPASALGFTMGGLALLLAESAYFKTFQALTFAGGLGSWLCLSESLYGGAPLFHAQRLAVHAAAAFFLLNLGTLCLRTNRGLMSLLVSDTSAGRIARRLVPAALLVTTVIGWIWMDGQRAGHFETETGAALFALTNAIVFGGLIWANAERLDEIETDRNLALETLHGAQERTRAIVDCSDDAILSESLDGTILTWNDGAERLFGYSAKEAIGQSILMLIPAERTDEEAEFLKRIGRGESINHYETVRVRKDGTPVHVSVTLSPLKNSEGKIIGASKIARDITEWKQSESRLQTQLERLDLLKRITRAVGERQDIQSIYQVVIRSLEDHLPIDFGCVCLYDPAAQSLTVARVGAKSAELAAELATLERGSISVERNGLTHCVQGHLLYEPSIVAECFPFSARLHRAGLRSMAAMPLQVESQVFGLLIVARKEAGAFSSGECDFLRQLCEQTALAAHQAQLYSALQRAYDDLRQTQHVVMQQERLRALGEMASGVAHDINNSLSPITLYADFLLDHEANLTAVGRGHLKTIQRAVSDVAETIARLKEFYREREPQLNLAPVRLNELARQVADLTRARWHDLPQQRGVVIQMQTELPAELPCITGSESEIREALVNLVFNAVDAMPQGGTITLRTKASAKNVVVQITDTGVGMNEETRRRCLEPFFTTKGERGTGLGLAMVYGIVQRHSGELEVESQLGRGTNISLIFPAAAGTNGAAKPPCTDQRAPSSRMRLLVVDDDPLVLKAMRLVLENDGHIVVTANGGQAGIDTFRAAFGKHEPFTAVITDLGMPYVDGRAVAGAVKAASPLTAVIMVTGWGKLLIADNDIPAHVDCIVSKPPKPSELREALAQHVMAA